MALKPKIIINTSSDCKTWYLQDGTDTYNALNLGGFGSPNPEISDVTAATVILTLSDGTVTDAIDVYDTLPNLNDILFEYTNEDAGLDAATPFPDGITSWEYSVTLSDGTEITNNGYQVVLCQLECCQKRLGSADLSCSKSKMKKFIEVSDYITKIKFSAACGNTTAVTTLLEKAQRLCAGTSCSCSSSSSGGCNC